MKKSPSWSRGVSMANNRVVKPQLQSSLVNGSLNTVNK